MAILFSSNKPSEVFIIFFHVLRTSLQNVSHKKTLFFFIENSVFELLTIWPKMFSKWFEKFYKKTFFLAKETSKNTKNETIAYFSSWEYWVNFITFEDRLPQLLFSIFFSKSSSKSLTHKHRREIRLVHIYFYIEWMIFQSLWQFGRQSVALPSS